MPFTLNPFSKTKLDYSNLPQAQPELPAKRRYFGEEDDKAINSQPDKGPSVTERTIVKEKEADDIPDFGR